MYIILRGTFRIERYKTPEPEEDILVDDDQVDEEDAGGSSSHVGTSGSAGGAGVAGDEGRDEERGRASSTRELIAQWDKKVEEVGKKKADEEARQATALAKRRSGRDSAL